MINVSSLAALARSALLQRVRENLGSNHPFEALLEVAVYMGNPRSIGCVVLADRNHGHEISSKFEIQSYLPNTVSVILAGIRALESDSFCDEIIYEFGFIQGVQ